LKGNIDILRDFDDGLEVTASRFFKWISNAVES
jgi:hypothetical protein